jgi:hypothetical protein
MLVQPQKLPFPLGKPLTLADGGFGIDILRGCTSSLHGQREGRHGSTTCMLGFVMWQGYFSCTLGA